MTEERKETAVQSAPGTSSENGAVSMRQHRDGGDSRLSGFECQNLAGGMEAQEAHKDS